MAGIGARDRGPPARQRGVPPRDARLRTSVRNAREDGGARPMSDDTFLGTSVPAAAPFPASDVDGLTAIERRAAQIFSELAPLNHPDNFELLRQHARWAAEQEADGD